MESLANLKEFSELSDLVFDVASGVTPRNYATLKVFTDKLMHMDWPELKGQKRKLLESDDPDLCDGLVNLIDTIQDFAVKNGYATEAEVFGNLNQIDAETGEEFPHVKHLEELKKIAREMAGDVVSELTGTTTSSEFKFVKVSDGTKYELEFLISDTDGELTCWLYNVYDETNPATGEVLEQLI